MCEACIRTQSREPGYLQVYANLHLGSKSQCHLQMAEEPFKKAHVCTDSDEGIPCQRYFSLNKTLVQYLAQSNFGTERLWPGCGDPHHTSVEDTVKYL